MGLDFIYTNKQTVPEPGFFFLHVIMFHIISFFVSGNHSMPLRPNLILSGDITCHCITNLIMFCSAMHCYYSRCRCCCPWEPKPVSVQPLTTIRVWARANFLLNTNTSYALRHAYFFPGHSAPSLCYQLVDGRVAVGLLFKSTTNKEDTPRWRSALLG